MEIKKIIKKATAWILLTATTFTSLSLSTISSANEMENSEEDSNKTKIVETINNKNTDEEIVEVTEKNEAYIPLEDGRIVTEEELMNIINNYSGDIQLISGNEEILTAFDIGVSVVDEDEVGFRNALSVAMTWKEALALLAGTTWFIPGVGQVTVGATLAVAVGGTVLGWVAPKVKDFLISKAKEKKATTKKAPKKNTNKPTEKERAANDIPSRLKKNGKVNKGLFNQKVSGKRVKYKEKKGWYIEKDTAGHKGSVWKVFNQKGERKASIKNDGTIVGK